MIPQLVGVELLPDAGPQGRNDGAELVVAVDPVRSRLLHVEHLAPQGQDGLEPGVPALGGGAAGGVALDDVDLCQGRVPFVAVPELVGHLAGLQPGFSPDGLPGLSRRLSGSRGGEGLLQDGPAHGGILLKELLHLLVDDGVDQGPDLGVAQLGLGLALELGLGEFHGDDAGEALPAVIFSSSFKIFAFRP